MKNYDNHPPMAPHTGCQLRRILTHDIERVMIVNYYHFGTFILSHTVAEDGTHTIMCEDFWTPDLFLAISFIGKEAQKLMKVRERINLWLRLNEEDKRHADA